MCILEDSGLVAHLLSVGSLVFLVDAGYVNPSLINVILPQKIHNLLEFIDDKSSSFTAGIFQRGFSTGRTGPPLASRIRQRPQVYVRMLYLSFSAFSTPETP